MKVTVKRIALVASLLGVLLISCDGDPELDAGTVPDAGPPPPTSALAAYDDPSDLYAAPWPDERLRGTDGRVQMSAFPNPRDIQIIGQLVDLVDGSDGFGLSSTIYIPLSGAIDETTLPNVHGSLDASANVFLMDVDPASPTPGARWPLDVSFNPDTGYGPSSLLALLPFQGRPLYPNRLYAAVVTTGVLGADGAPILPAAATLQIARGEQPAGMSAAAFGAHEEALTALTNAGVAPDTIAAMAVFRTWDPAADLIAARAQVLAATIPSPDIAFTLTDTFDDYCVFESQISMPDFQTGDAPYSGEGGSWAYDASGDLVVQRNADSTLIVTVPRREMPVDGFDAAVFIRTGGGGDRPMIERGARSTRGGPADVPGTGPARAFALAGFAGVQVDGPLGGLRNADGWDEQFAIFNINNIPGLRDNVRQSALELMLLPAILDTLVFDASTCAGFSTSTASTDVTLDISNLAIMGHSMGATIAPLVVALEPAYRATILSGAGGSWIFNIVDKLRPIHVRPAAENLLGYTGQGRTLVAHDPALGLLQWAGEVADPQVYARWLVDEPIIGEPRHVLMFQGILDTYIPPPIANPLSLALNVDLAGGALDETLADTYEPLSPFLDLSGGAQMALPASGNRTGGATTAVVVQHNEDGIEDGHEIVFQAAEPPMQYRCFLESLASGTGAPRVPARDATACD